MIRKIISGGQTGADRAALDTAMYMQIPHGGWIAKGRKTEDGMLPEKYKLQEMPTEKNEERTEKNVIESDGTLIFSHGKLMGGSQYTLQCAEKHNRPRLHMDMDRTNAFQAVQSISEWIQQNHIEVLNVAGPRQSEDPGIYKSVCDIMEVVLNMDMTQIPLSSYNLKGIGKRRIEDYISLPQDVDRAVSHMISKLSFQEKTKIANSSPRKRKAMVPSFSTYIATEFRLGGKNDPLLEDCRQKAGKPDMNFEEAAVFIFEKIYERLQEAKVLKVVK